jgi:tape measure domain-containing protein
MPDRIDDVIDSKKIIAELNNVYAAMSKVASLIVTINSIAQNTNFSNFKQGFQYLAQMQANLAALNAAKTNAINQEAALKAALLQSQTAYQNLRNQIAQLTLAQKQAAAQNRNNNKAEAGSIMDLRNQLRKLIQLWDSYGPATRKANAQTLEDIKRIEAELKKLEAETGRFQRNVGNYPQVTQLVGGLKGLLGQFGVALGAGAIAKEIFDTSVKVDSLNAGLKAVSGTTEDLVINQKFLREEGERLGLNVLDLTNSYKLFYAASTQSGLNADTTRRIFNSVAESAANLRLSTENTNGVLLAFSQILGKGKVQAEELRGQIGERVPGAFHIAAKSIGVTEQQLDKMLKKGEVIASDFLPKFAAELEKTFGVDDEKKVEGLQSSINRLSNSFSDLVNNNQSALSKFFTLFINLAREALVSVNNLLGGVTYLSLKLTDKNAAQDFLNAKALDEYSEKLKKLNSGDLLSQRNNVDQKTEQVENRLQGNLATIKSIRDAYGRNADTVYGAFITRIEKIVAEDQATLKLLEGQRIALIAELKKRFPATGTGAEAQGDKEATKAELDKAAQLREQAINAEAEARKKAIQEQINQQKDILDNEKNTFSERMAANEEYIGLKDKLAEVDAQQERDILEVRVGRNKASAEQIKKIEADLQYKKAEDVREGGKNITKILSDNADQQTKRLINEYETQKQALEKAQNAELDTLQDLYTRKRITQEQYELEAIRIRNKYDILDLQAEADMQQQVIDILKQRGEPTAEAENKLLEIKNKIRELDIKYTDDTEKKKTSLTQQQIEKRRELEEQYSEKIKGLQSELASFIGEAIQGQFEGQKNRVQAQIDQIDKRKEAEIAAINEQVLTEEQKADRIALINAQSLAQKEALERRQRQIDTQAAIFQKGMALLQIAITTSEAIAKIQAQAAILAATPGLGQAFAAQALAQIPIVIAVGALQAAAIAAKPVPRYRLGRKGGPAENAIVGDGGVPEVISSPDGSQAWITPAQDTLTYIPKDFQVHSSVDDYIKAAKWSAYRAAPVVNDSAVSSRLLARDIVEGVTNGLGAVTDAINSRPSERTVITAEGMKHQWYDGKTWNDYLNKYMR